jgi:hypothetical protein
MELDDVAEPMMAEVVKGRGVRQVSGDRVRDVGRQDDLSAVSRVRDATRFMDDEADVVVPGVRRHTAVDPDAYPKFASIGPLVARQAALRVEHRAYRTTDVVEDEEEGVAHGADLDAAVFRDGRTDDPIVLLEQRNVVVAKCVDESRRPLDVGEDECHRPRREPVFHRRIHSAVSGHVTMIQHPTG